MVALRWGTWHRQPAVMCELHDDQTSGPLLYDAENVNYSKHLCSECLLDVVAENIEHVELDA